MSASVRNLSSASLADPAFAALLEEVANKCLAGEPVDWSAYECTYPQHLEELRRLMPAMQAVADLSRSAREGDAAPVCGDDRVDGTLGDFRILREIGRGGMGLVYEAEQISLKRQVALKVLPFAATMDARQLQRFKNEAQAAAQLHHTNIVPVYYVGCERGVHFYAMQYIEGQSLAQVIGDLRLQISDLQKDSKSKIAPQDAAVVTGPYTPESTPKPDISNLKSEIPSTKPIAALSTVRSTKDPAYFRTVAQLAIQAAEALDHAHQQGIVHRDVKPANLLVDAGGRLWVTDFGLAQVQSDTRLTMTGDLVGTLRYMSPEQALAKRVVVDHRTDVYSLGATLYELLTLEPAFGGADRQELLRQIAFEEPRPLRRRNKAIPAELQVIVLKALEKNPTDRYATAKELAEDLERFIKDEPIRARRPGVVQRTRKWARRHRSVVITASVALVIAFLSLFAAAALFWQEKEQAEAALEREQRTGYFLRIAVADREWWLGNMDRAEHLLDECPQQFRHFEWHYLKGQCHTELIVQKRLNPTGLTKFSADGSRLACFSLIRGTNDGASELTLWDGTSFRQLLSWPRREYPLPHENVMGLALSHDGRRVAMGTRIGIKLLDVETGEVILLPDAIATALAFSPDGTRLAAMGKSGIKVWDIAARRETLCVQGLFPRAFSFDPSGERLAYDSGNHVQVCDLRTGKEAAAFALQSGMYSLCFHPDGKRLAAAVSDGTVHMWDIEKSRELHTIRAHAKTCNCLAFSPDGRLLASGGSDRMVRIWDSNTGQEERAFRGHENSVMAVAFQQGGNCLASVGIEGTLRVWNATSDQTSHTVYRAPSIAARACSSAVGPIGGLIAMGHQEGAVTICDCAKGEHRLTLRASEEAVLGIDFSPCGRFLATASRNAIKLWELATHRELFNLGAAGGKAWGGFSLAFTLDGRRLAVAQWGGPIHLWDTENGRQLLCIDVVGDGITGLAFSPDGMRLFSVGGDTFLRAWDTANGQELFGFDVDNVNQAQTAFSPDRRRLAAMCSDGVERIWDTATGKEVGAFNHGGPGLFSPVFSSDGSRLAATQPMDGTILLWDVETGQQVLRLVGHTGTVRWLAFSPDGRRLVSSGLDGTVRVWGSMPKP